MTDFGNKYFKIKIDNEELFIKTGKFNHDYNSAGIVLEILDYSGNIELLTGYIRIDDKIIFKMNYIFIEKMFEITSNEYYDILAYEIMKFIVRKSFKQIKDMEILKFNPTEERRSLYNKLKIPLIIKETIV